MRKWQKSELYLHYGNYIKHFHMEVWNGMLCCAKLLQLCPTLCNLWIVACQAPLSVGFFRQEYWSGLLFLFQGIFLTQESNPGLLHCRQMIYQLSYEGSPDTKLILQIKCWITYNLFRLTPTLTSMAKIQVCLALGPLPFSCSVFWLHFFMRIQIS